MGRALVQKLVDLGEEVIVTFRSTYAVPPGVKVFAGERSNVIPHLSKMKLFDVVIDNTAYSGADVAVGLGAFRDSRYVMDSQQRVTPIDPNGASQRAQDLPPRWHDAGQFYWGRTVAWLNHTPILANAVGHELNASEVQDIDEEEDWLRAEIIHASLQQPHRFGQP